MGRAERRAKRLARRAANLAIVPNDSDMSDASYQAPLPGVSCNLPVVLAAIANLTPAKRLPLREAIVARAKLDGIKPQAVKYDATVQGNVNAAAILRIIGESTDESVLAALLAALQ